ncbi:hypothetical protein HN51_037635 [Arachis hypogaea]|uniref:Protein PLASTID REDOX INSENSITIVE 2, chloroplastic n=1 Tax=Arachis duranensis TaxID=130453 RepID=A0A6P4CZV6_ARADU|nr:protein PLASTID REDOX INSENSITIVE 2, chloroplastic [Arachis duranensis]
MKLFSSFVASSSSSSSSSYSFPTTTLYPLPAALILRTPCLILRHPLPLSPPSLSARYTLPRTLSASPTHNHAYPAPSPHFAQFETRKFKVELLQKLSDDTDEFGNDLDAVVDVCAQIFHEFLCKEYGGPGTLLVEPFTDMLVALKKKKLPGAALAARASLLWAQSFVDEDWEVWNSKLK